MNRIIQSATKPLFAESTLDSIKRSLTASNQFEYLIKKYSDKLELNAMKESIAASNSIIFFGKKDAEEVLAPIGRSQAQPEPQVLNMPRMHFPKNPILVTNQILENLTGEIEDLRPLVAQGAELIRCMNDSALQARVKLLLPCTGLRSWPATTPIAVCC